MIQCDPTATNMRKPFWPRLGIQAGDSQPLTLQLPAPDHRWIRKFRGNLWGPFDQQFGGWQDINDLISDRTRSLFGTSLEQTGMFGEATLSGSGWKLADSYAEAV